MHSYARARALVIEAYLITQDRRSQRQHLWMPDDRLQIRVVLSDDLPDTHPQATPTVLVPTIQLRLQCVALPLGQPGRLQIRRPSAGQEQLLDRGLALAGGCRREVCLELIDAGEGGDGALDRRRGERAGQHL